jgi:gliding motility-associated-like protein
MTLSRKILGFNQIFLIVFILLISQNNGFNQVVSLGCQNQTSATLGLDRNDWNNGSTDFHSEASMHNFVIPANTFGDCKKIGSITATVTIFNVDNSNLPPECSTIDYYYNFYNNCTGFQPASCPGVGGIGPQSTPMNQVITFTSPPETFDFGTVFGADIIPAFLGISGGACANGQMLISSGSLSLDYEICVEMEVVDLNPTSSVDLGMDESVCPNTTTLLDAGSFDNYIWSPGGETSQTISAGAGTYTVTVTDNVGCTSSDEISVTEFPASQISFDPPNPSGCDGGTVQVSVLETYNSYNWSDSQSGQTVNLSPGNYTVTITDSNNCAFESSITVGDLTSPNAGIDNFITVCNDGSLTDMDAQLGPNDSGGNWNDDDGSGLDININPTAVDFSVLATGTYNFTYTVLGTAPCNDDEATITVQVAEENFSGISNAEQFCQDSGDIDFFALLSNPTLGGNFIDVNNTLVNLSNGFAVNLDGLPPNTYEYIYNLNMNGSCPPSQTQLFITIVSGVEAGANNQATVCEGTTVDLTGLLSADADNDGAFSDDDLTTQLNGSSFNTSGLAGSSYNFSYTVGSAGSGCGVDMSVFTITVESSVTSGGDVNADICEGEEIDLFDILMNEDTGGVFSDLSGNGGLTDNMLNTDGLPTGVSEYQYLVGDGVSCPKDSSLISINIISAPSIDIPIDSITVCPDNCESITFSLTGTAPFEFSTTVFSESGSVIGSGLSTTTNNTVTLTACNLDYTTSYANDTLNLSIDSSYFIVIPSIQDDNCNNDFGGREDTIYVQALDFARFQLDTTACINDTLTINGVEFFNGNATLMDTLAGQFCDSIVDISVTFSTADTILINPTICQEDFIEFQGMIYDITQPTDEISIVSPNGCDSLVIIDLSFYTPIDSIINLELCSGDSIIVNGVTYDFDNTFGSEVLEDESVNGCNINVDINLTFTNDIMIMRNDTLCNGQTINIGGELFDEINPSGTVQLTGSGCDTMITVDLTFLDAVTSTLEGPFCSTYSETINGNTYDSTNPIGQETLLGGSVAGCDSIIDINLTFFPILTTDINEELCIDDGIMVNGVLYNFGNPTGQETLQSVVNGCDSTINVNLTFDPLIETPIALSPCVGDSVFVSGAFQFTDGEYRDTFQTIENCDSIVITTVTFTPCAFNVEITPTNDLCGNGSGSILIETSSPAGESYSIILEDENNSTDVIPLQVGPNIMGLFDNLAPGTYIVTITDSNNMTVYTNSVTIVSSGITISGMWDLTTPITCEGGTGTITYSPNGGQPPYQFSWSDPLIGDTNVGENLLPGNYSLTVTDVSGCTGETSFQLEDGVTQTVTLDIVDPSCTNAADGSITIQGLNQADGPYIISVNGTVNDSVHISNLSVGTYDIAITDSNLCEINITETLSSSEISMFAEYQENYNITIGDSISIVGAIDSGTYMFVWTPDDNSLSCSDCALPIASPTESTVYNLEITDISGCAQSLAINVEVEPAIIVDVVPNIFSPNGDGVNDNFTFESGSENTTSIQIGIFDRWGNLIYEDLSATGSVTWDGRMNNTQLGSGVYIYQITILYNDATSKNLNGDVTLIK